MLQKLYDYMILPTQLSILFEDYSIITYEIVDSYVYICDVYTNGVTKKTEFICVKIKKYGEPTIYCSSMDLTLFLEKCLIDQRTTHISMKKKMI